MKTDKAPHLHSKVFARMFLSYVAIIAAAVAVYCAWYLHTYAEHREDMARREAQQQIDMLGTRMDQQLLSAQGLCAAVNTSSSCREILQTAYIEHKTINSMQLFRVLSELTRIKSSSNNLNVYNLMLCFQGDDKAYTAGGVIDYAGENAVLSSAPYVGMTTVGALLGVEGASGILMNKEYLVYADSYTMASAGAVKGTVLVLMEKSGLTALMRGALSGMNGARVTRDGGEETLLLTGETEGVSFTSESMVVPGLTYEAYLPARALRAKPLAGALIPLLGSALLGLAFICLSYLIARRTYQPIGSIGSMIGTTRENEIDGILSGIRDLIGERDGYREKVVTISPYARQGVLHSLLSGGASGGQLDVLIDEHFLSLRRACYMLAVVNVADATGESDAPERLREVRARVQTICREMSGEKLGAVCCIKNPANLYVILSSDDEDALEPAVRQLYERICEALDDRRYLVTVGAGRLERDLGRLADACRDAEEALGQMLVGGRSSVYFAEGLRARDERRYAFPKDAYRRAQQALRAGDLDALDALLDEIYRQNIVERDLPLAQVRAMVDELHLTLCAALHAFPEGDGSYIRIERIGEAATVDEIFAYYRQALRTAVEWTGAGRKADDPNALARAICEAIDERLYDPQLSLSALADRFGVSTKAVNEACKQAHGQTFLQYVHARQIERAAELLTTTQLSLEEIARDCGFTNLLTFRRNFKAEMGVNPSEYRR